MQEQIQHKTFKRDGHTFNLKQRSIAVSEILPFLKKEMVLDLCRQCPNFDNQWSCPTVVPDFEKFSSRFKNAEILLFWSETSQFAQEENPSTTCYEFLKKKSAVKVLKLEKKLEGRAILSFSCNHCKECSKKENLPCRKPSKMRYNLTAFGFLIDDISRELMNHELSWSKDKKEAEYITQVSLVLHN